jgi:hypothetical protein
MRVSIARVGAVAVLFVFGCGGGNGGGSEGGATTPPTDTFVGTWTADAGSMDFTCTGIYPASIPFTGATMTVTKDDATHVTATFTLTGAACAVQFAVSVPPTPLTAPAQTSQTGTTCAVSDGRVSGEFVISSGDMYFDDTNTNHLTLRLSGDFVPAGSSTVACAVSADGTFPSS